MFKSGKAIVPTNGSGTVPDAAVTPADTECSFGVGGKSQLTIGVFITNREAVAGNPLEVSFNEGRDWFTIATNMSLAIPVMIHRIRVRGLSGATADYSVMGVK
jgi:hypothetical protein